MIRWRVLVGALLPFLGLEVFANVELSRPSPSSWENVQTDDVTLQSVDTGPARYVLEIGTHEKWPGLRFLPVAAKVWDLSPWSALELDIENPSDTSLTVHLRVDNMPGSHGRLRPWITQKTVLAPGESRTVRADLRRFRAPDPPLIGMQHLPRGLDSEGIDVRRITSVLLFFTRSTTPRRIIVGPLRATTVYRPPRWEQTGPNDFFPFVSRYGQFLHASDDVVTTDAQLLVQRQEEDLDLKAHSVPTGRSDFGGYRNGPRLRASGHFRVERVNQKWWLVDPAGYLFWSHGVGVVGRESPTVVAGREHYFMPSVLANLDDEVPTHDFARANALIKYGENFESTRPARISARLNSWGMNTFGLWSDRTVINRTEQAYTDWVYYESPQIPAVADAGHIVDMWHPEFTQRLDQAAARLAELNGDPRLLGVFVDNEIKWGDATSFAQRVMDAPATQPARQRLLEFVEGRYATLADFNEAWASDLTQWSDLPERMGALTAPHADMHAFYALSARQYYRTVARILRHHAPDKLYLCSRFNGYFPVAERAAAEYCDVLSYNLYRDSVAQFAPSNGLDKPVLISEWHLGLSDGAMFGSGLVAVSVDKRSVAFSSYLGGALRNENIVGAHWFQYRDEPLTGRPLDGENFQIGFVDVTDTPYAELVDAARTFSSTMYEGRLGAGEP